ncbi:helix-turn-helix domain-containing protein [Lentzea sp. CA-135723]|uniref:helix-turn-helix domain-containing protein n=1 Tax=Lentzea sp. CA-135723 TaxID=3239950 RepID=UPI003D8EA4E3
MSNAHHVIELTKYLYKIPEAMVLLSMSRSVIYEQMRAGRLRFVKQGRATLVSATAIRDYVSLLEQESVVHYGETA